MDGHKDPCAWAVGNVDVPVCVCVCVRQLVWERVHTWPCNHVCIYVAAHKTLAHNPHHTSHTIYPFGSPPSPHAHTPWVQVPVGMGGPKFPPRAQGHTLGKTFLGCFFATFSLSLKVKPRGYICNWLPCFNEQTHGSVSWYFIVVDVILKVSVTSLGSVVIGHLSGVCRRNHALLLTVTVNTLPLKGAFVCGPAFT